MNIKFSVSIVTISLKLKRGPHNTFQINTEHESEKKAVLQGRSESCERSESCPTHKTNVQIQKFEATEYQ